MRLSVRAKLLGASGVLLVLTCVVALAGVLSLSAVSDRGSQMLDHGITPVHTLDDINASLLERARLASRADSMIGDAAFQEQTDTQSAAVDKQIAADIAAFKATEPTDAELTLLADFQAKFDKYVEGMNAIRVSVRAGTKAPPDVAAALGASRAAAMDAVKKLTSMAMARANELNAQIATTRDSALLIIGGALLLAVVLGFAISFILARRVRAGVAGVESVVRSISENDMLSLEQGLVALASNDLTVEARVVTEPIAGAGSDEIGEAARMANAMVERLSATVAAYESCRRSLAEAVGEVQDAAQIVASASGDLTTIANQVATATGQVASTIGQVAAGAGDQARAASTASNAVSILADRTREVGSGAGQAAKVLHDSRATLAEMTDSIDLVEGASKDVDAAAERAAGAANRGTAAVGQTVEGMSRIKDAVEGAAVKVRELGSKGNQIGAIVETIDDIAEQTNLLALNAAIEAARAGEQGKGFAVVADEVRKLAERSSRATKEIAALIAEVQKGTDEAVRAMAVGASEVEAGASLADGAGQSLDEIIETVTSTKLAAERIASSIRSLADAGKTVVESVELVGTISAENASMQSTMVADADETMRAVESIAAVAEENSASAEEVSAATEELSAHAEEVVSSARSLADMADRLEALVARFHLEGSGGRAGARAAGTASGSVIPRRRASDWGRAASAAGGRERVA